MKEQCREWSACSIREQLRSLQQSTWPHTEEGGHTPGPGRQTTQALPGSPAAHSPSIPSLRLPLRSSPPSSSQPQPRRLHGNYVKHKAGNTGREKRPLLGTANLCRKEERRLQIEIETWRARLHPKLLLPPGGEARAGALCHTAYSPSPSESKPGLQDLEWSLKTAQQAYLEFLKLVLTPRQLWKTPLSIC